MKWSQLKTRIESLLADSVNERVGIQTTRYHKAHDQMGRSWITVDGQEVVNMCSFAAEMALRREATQLQQARGCTDYRNPEQREGYHAAYDDAHETLRRQGIFNRHEFNRALFDYLNLSIETILTSPDPIIRAIGMLDRRVGRRRLAAVDVEHEHPLVRKLHEFRCEAEEAVTGSARSR